MTADVPRRGRTIVMAAEFWFGATGAGLANGLRQLGWDVAEVDQRLYRVGAGRSLPLRLAARALQNRCMAAYNQAIMAAVELHQPQAFLTIKGGWLSTATLEQMRRRGIKTVNYYPDFHFDYVGLDQATFPLFDLFFTTKSFQVEYLARLLGRDRVHFLHHGYSSLVHRPRLSEVREADYVADVLYVGNHSGYKEKWLAGLARALPDVKLMIVGDGWGEARARIGPRAVVSAAHIVGDGYARLVQSARINLAIHSGPGASNGWEDLVSTRTFELPACRGFMLHIDNDEVRGLFKPGREIDVFATEEEMCLKVEEYLASPNRRHEMLEHAFKRCVSAYSYDERARSIANAIER